MINIGLYFLLHLSFLHSVAIADPSAASSPQEFIKTSCKTTLYPTLCLQSLSTYSPPIQPNKRQLAEAALQISLSTARSAAGYVSKLYELRGSPASSIEYQAVRDCIQNMADSVYQLSQSTRELGRLNQAASSVAAADEPGFHWHMSNVETWVSAALTDDTTCLDGISGFSMDQSLKDSMKSRVTNVAQVTSVALAFVHHFAERHRDVAPASKP